MSTDLPWPPPTIDEWMRGGGVNTERLVGELRAWADAFGQPEPLGGYYVQVDEDAFRRALDVLAAAPPRRRRWWRR